MSDVEIVDAEIVGPPTPYLDHAGNIVPTPVHPPSAPAAPVNLFGADSPADVVSKATEIAVVLKDVLDQRGHIQHISGNDHVKVEGWTTLGAMLGVTAVTTHTEAVEGGFMATAEARTIDGRVVGRADALCTRAERTWAKRDDYALLSMAQTRAASKALRVPLGFVIELAGYNPTPAEEMTFATGASAADSTPGRQSGSGAGQSHAATAGPPPLLMSEDDRGPNGSFPAECPYCRSEIVEETKTIKRGKPDEREATFTNCTNNMCQGGEPKRDGGFWPWSVFGSLEGTIEAGGRIDELINGGGQKVENITPKFDPKEYLHRTINAPEWDDTQIKDRITAAKKATAHGKRWNPEVTAQVATMVMNEYLAEHPPDEGEPLF